MGRRLSPQSGDVLRALAVEPAQWRYGYELGQQVGLRAGSLYPILMRLSDRGMLEDSWESDPPAGRPPRHLYRLTAAGRLAAAELSSGPQIKDSVRRVAEHRHGPRSAW
jgi:DNA-binding PadR family transcriptional regulator